MSEFVDIGRIIDERPPGWFTVRLVVITFLLVLADGFDIAAIGFAAPGMIHDFQITDMNVMGPIFGASLVGILIGAPLFGAFGDRFGRKQAIIFACLLFGLVTWGTAVADSVRMVIVLRLFAGIGIGGLLPNVGALVAEWAPKRWRATMLIVMFSGVAFGGALPGVVSAILVASHGWQVIFLIGGVFPVVVGLASFWLLPESAKFLVLRGKGGEGVARSLAGLQGEELNSQARFTVGNEKPRQGWAIVALFSDGLALMTVLLWLLFALNLMGYFFLLSWTPTVLAAANMAPSNAAIAGVLTQIGGVIGGLLLARPMDRIGIKPIVLLLGLAVPVVAGIGMAAAGQMQTLLFVLQFCAGFCVLGAQTGLNAAAGILYPTAVRSNGVGMAFGIGRLGSIVGPVVGGYLISRHLPVDQLYLAAALPFVVGCIACLIMARLYQRRIFGVPPDAVLAAGPAQI